MVRSPAPPALFHPSGDAPVDNRLRTPLADAFARLPDSWRPVADAFACSAAGTALSGFVDERVRAGTAVYPAAVFRALELTAPADVRVAIIGQDPYHRWGQAQGLAFSVAAGQTAPPSLRNVLKEVHADTGEASQCRDDLTPWATQGVLLLNSVLTVEDGLPQSHAGHGWEVLTDALLARVSAQPEPVVFLLWGAGAQRKRALLDGRKHFVLTANHPSPLSALRRPEPFLGCRHFSRANELLRAHRPDGRPIRW